MMFANVFAYLRRRIEARRQYQRTIAEIAAMSQNDLIEIGAFQTDLYRAARQDYLASI